MELFKKVMHYIDVNLILCLIPMILILAFIEFIFKNKFQTKKALLIISWIILGFSLLNLLHFLIGIGTNEATSTFIKRASGSYKITYWFILFLSTIFPFILFVRKYATNYWIVFSIAVLMKVGAYFEYFVILMSNMHRTHQTKGFDLFPSITIVFLQSIIFIVIILGTLSAIERRKAAPKTFIDR